MKEKFSCTCVNSPIGRIYIKGTRKGICYISISKFSPKLEKLIKIKQKSSLLKKCSNQLEDYFNRKRKTFTIPLDFPEGTEFEKKVWETLQKIPYGKTWTYKMVAEKIERPKSYRAVGNAIGKNPTPIIIPCHRVIREDGKLGGFSSGVEIKKKLLKLEGVMKL